MVVSKQHLWLGNTSVVIYYTDLWSLVSVYSNTSCAESQRGRGSECSITPTMPECESYIFHLLSMWPCNALPCFNGFTYKTFTFLVCCEEQMCHVRCLGHWTTYSKWLRNISYYFTRISVIFQIQVGENFWFIIYYLTLWMLFSWGLDAFHAWNEDT